MLFDHLDLFRFLDFVLLLLFVLGVLCPVEYPFYRSVIYSFTALFHGASHHLSDSLNPNSAEFFKYIWLDFGF